MKMVAQILLQQLITLSFLGSNQWFKLYPEFQANPFYITGESYAGIYVPTLVSRVAKGTLIIMTIIFLQIGF